MSPTNRNHWQRGRIVSVDLAADTIAQIVITTDTPVRPEPGSHVDVRIATGDVRSYSVVSGGVNGRTVTLAVHLSPNSRGGSRFMHALRPGDELGITAPLQNFPLRVGAPGYVLLAGGIGITAVTAMGATLERLGAEYRFVYVGRSRSMMAFLPELTEMHGDRLEVHIDDEGTGLDIPTLVDGIDPHAELYMCGPIRLMDAVRRSWLARNLPLPNLRYETFGNSGWFDAEEFVVKVPDLDVATTVGTGESLLDALERAGVDVMFDCRKGECGLCQVDIASIDGTVDHRDVFYSEQQKSATTKLCACVSRVVRRPDPSGMHSATGTVTLDIR
ncbi:PDR/VanB family oxidoreductase [Rhodococcus opacus]|uniref:PDR/VanB family oxidoreductase n=1 Tax=Rhodococcus opacus TaxID=37919 RepID=UPI001C43EC4A|nr:PDR/VanB family oxidoreductase [Rhodococcus opacus]MBV6762317.1 PDR/VanB family oxidoreductase [Rhodococcus opacus]